MDTAVQLLAVAIGGGLLTVLYQWHKDRRIERATAAQETEKETAFRHQHGGTVASSDAATVFAEMGLVLERYKLWLDQAEARALRAEQRGDRLEDELEEVRQHVRDQDEIIRKLKLNAEDLQRRCEECIKSLEAQGIDTEGTK